MVRESPRPVVLVPPRAGYLGGKDVTSRRVLIPLDGSAAALRVIPRLRNELVELIAMSTRGESGLQRIFLGSIAEYVVRRSEIPVLLVTARSGTIDSLSD